MYHGKGAQSRMDQISDWSSIRFEAVGVKPWIKPGGLRTNILEQKTKCFQNKLVFSLTSAWSKKLICQLNTNYKV